MLLRRNRTVGSTACRCVVGCDGSIDDEAAIAFTRGFYRAIAHGRSYDEAFSWGHNEINMSFTKTEADKYISI